MTKYWQDRFLAVEAAANKKSVAEVHRIEENYRNAAAAIDREINAWYTRFANNNSIDITEARKLLNSKELKELKWDVKQYIKKGEENALDQRWIKELENASARFHINRLDALKLQARQAVEVATGGLTDNVDKMLKDVYTDTYYHSIYEAQHGTGVGFNVAKLDDDYVQRILTKPWATDGTNFSDKLWRNKSVLLNTLDRELTRMALTGEAPDKTIKRVQKALDTSASNASRLVLTEQAYFTTLSEQDSYKELGVEEFEILATLDSVTCDECGSYDGQHIAVKDMMPGLNAPPFHPYCRCTTVPYFPDDWGSTRASRDEDGRTIHKVPANMTYEQWSSQYITDLEQEIRISKKSSSNVDRNYVNSKKYHDEFESIGLSKKACESAYYESKAILEKADGSDKEYLTAIDSRTGKRLATTLKYNTAKDNRVSFNLSDSEKVYNHEGGIIQIHNHSKNGRPSGSDILSCFRYKNVDHSIISCHDGDLFVLSDFNRKIDVAKIYEEYYNNQIRIALHIADDEPIPEKVEKAVAKDCKIKATSQLYDLNKKKHMFKITKYSKNN